MKCRCDACEESLNEKIEYGGAIARYIDLLLLLEHFHFNNSLDHDERYNKMITENCTDKSHYHLLSSHAIRDVLKVVDMEKIIDLIQSNHQDFHNEKLLRYANNEQVSIYNENRRS